MTLNLSVKNAEKIKEKFQKKIDELQKKIDVVNDFVEMVEQYSANTDEQKVIKYYAQLGVLKSVATKLNEEGIKFNGRKWHAQDVSKVIQRKPEGDELHAKIIETFGENFGAITRSNNKKLY